MASCLLCTACIGGCMCECGHKTGIYRYCPEKCLELGSKPTVLKYYHFLMYSFFMVFAFTISYACLNSHIASLLPNISMIYGSCIEKKSLYCYGVNTVYRISLALTTFYIIHFLLAIFKKFYLNCYLVRWLVFFAMSGLSMFVPGVIVQLYAWISMPVAGGFLILTTAIWVDFAYEWQQLWIQRNSRFWNNILNTLTAIFTIAFIGLSVIMYFIFNCKQAYIFNTINLTLGVTLYLIPFLFKQTINFLPISVIVLYNTYIIYTALNYGLGLESYCYFKIQSETVSHISFFTIFDTVCIISSLIWSAFSIANQHNFFKIGKNDIKKNIFYENELTHLGEEMVNLNNIISEEKETEVWAHNSAKKEVVVHPSFFVVMILASCYMLSILSGWRVYGDNLQSKIDSGKTTMYIKFVSVGICYILFVLRIGRG